MTDHPATENPRILKIQGIPGILTKTKTSLKCLDVLACPRIPGFLFELVEIT
jgi:hypothetical protein